MTAQQLDVAIIGGGLAGLSLALHLKRIKPSLAVQVFERKGLPYPEATHKVGESTVELAAYYFAETLGLRDHLRTQQLRKLGLRLFFTKDGNTKISERPEMGSDRHLAVPTYQIDRGRFENFLVEEASRHGVTVSPNSKVSGVSLSSNEAAHIVSYESDTSTHTIAARWVVDASGRAAVIKRSLALTAASEHDSNAVWFRVKDKVNIDAWCDDSEWLKGHQHEFSRWFSTNHLTGEGYWVWLIPLASGYTSIGVVTDPKRHPLARFRSFEDTLTWLREYEPQLATQLETRKDLLADYLALKHYAHKCTRVLSPDRWAITGDAGVFIDPLYSPGSDFIAIQNTLIVDTISRESAGERFVGRAELYNDIYRQLTDSVLKSFAGQYDLLGNARVMPLKVVWDYTVYWGFLAFITVQGKLCDPSVFKSIEEGLGRVYSQNERMQELLRAQHYEDQATVPSGMLDIAHIPFLLQLNAGITAPHDTTSFMKQLDENIALIGEVYERLVVILSEAAGAWRTFGELTELLASVGTGARMPSRVVKKGSVVSILRVLTKRGGDDEKTGGVSTEIR